MRRFLARLSNVPSPHLPSARRRRRRIFAIVVLGLFALASGLICGTRLLAQQGPPPGENKSVGRSNEPIRKAEERAHAVRSRTFREQLRGAQQEPVFLDVETRRYLTPPTDLVPEADRGKPIEQWVFTDALKAWVHSQGIDFAAQTDGRTHVAVIGFDVRTGAALARSTRDLGPALIAQLVDPLSMDSAKWNFTKNLADVIPFVTREGAAGSFSVSIEPFLHPGSIEFRCQLARGPDVAKLAGQTLLPILEPAILGSDIRMLVADVIDQELRLRLPGRPDEILMGGGLVVVRGPSGIEIRAARLGTVRFELDGTKDRVNFSRQVRGSRMVLRRVGQRVQIEMGGRVAEADRLSLRMPEQKLADEKSLSWKTVPAQPSDRAEDEAKTEARRKNGEAATRSLAEMAQNGYGLRPGQSVGHVALPFPTARAEYWSAAHPTQYYPMAERSGPVGASYRWDGDHLREWWIAGGGYRLTNLVDALHGIKSHEISGPADLLETPLPGDWVVRLGSSDEMFAHELETLLRGEFKLPIHLEFRDVQRDVYVARGRFHFIPLPDQPGTKSPNAGDKTEGSNDVQIFGKRLYADGRAGGGFGDFDEFAKWAGRWIDATIVNQVTDPPKRLTWILHEQTFRRTPTTRKEAHDPKLVLRNIERQTSLQFTKESRPVKMLFVERIP